MNDTQLSRLGQTFRQRHEMNRQARDRAESQSARWGLAVTMVTVLVVVGLFAFAQV